MTSNKFEISLTVSTVTVAVSVGVAAEGRTPTSATPEAGVAGVNTRVCSESLVHGQKR